MKKLLIIVPSLQLGGQERVAVNTARIMAPDYDVTMVIFDGRDAVYSVDCEVINLKIPAAPGTLKKVMNVLLRAARLRKLRRERKIDFSFSLGPTANLANVLSGGQGATVVRTSSYIDCADSFLNRYIYRHCDRVICCAEGIRTKLLSTFGLSEQTAITVKNPFDVNNILQRGEEDVRDFDFSEDTVISHGRLSREKNFPRLIKAFSLVREKVPGAKLLIIGEGEQRPELEALIARYGLADHATLLGYRNNPFSYLKRASVFVLSSYYEGFPNALVEGMCFLPAVAVDCKTGPREILSDGSIDTVCKGVEETNYGVLVQPADENERGVEKITESDKALADAVLRLLRDEKKRLAMQQCAAERVQEFSFERYRECIERVL